jgi:hypothetical protein
MPTILISYRRQDSSDITRRIYDQLVLRYGKRSVYIDIQSIQPSADYRAHIRHNLERALVVLSVIGGQWHGPRADRDPRIFDAEDPVRVEVETALYNHRAVMPVLVNGARMPEESQLPDSLKPFHYLHALTVRSGDEFSSDIKSLFLAIDKLHAQFWAFYAATCLAMPLSVMLISQYLILFKYDTNPLYLRITIALVSAALGIWLCFQIGFRAVPTIITSAVVALASAVGMLAINTTLSNPSAPFEVWDILPSITRDWQEAIEYSLIVTSATWISNMLGWAFREWRARLRVAQSE